MSYPQSESVHHFQQISLLDHAQLLMGWASCSACLKHVERGHKFHILMHLQIQCVTLYCITFLELLNFPSKCSICCSLYNRITLAQDLHAPDGLRDALMLDWKTTRHLVSGTVGFFFTIFIWTENTLFIKLNTLSAFNIVCSCFPINSLDRPILPCLMTYVGPGEKYDYINNELS
jgi:hypothetical protein